MGTDPTDSVGGNPSVGLRHTVKRWVLHPLWVSSKLIPDCSVLMYLLKIFGSRLKRFGEI
jgi:hypothetical protein